MKSIVATWIARFDRRFLAAPLLVGHLMGLGACTDSTVSMPSSAPIKYIAEAAHCDWTDPDCIVRPPNDVERQRIQEEIDRITGFSDDCQTMRALLQAKLAGGDLQLYDRPNGEAGDWHGTGDIHISTVDGWTTSVDETLRHEAWHDMGAMKRPRMSRKRCAEAVDEV